MEERSTKIVTEADPSENVNSKETIVQQLNEAWRHTGVFRFSVPF